MNPILTTYRDYLPPMLRELNWRTHPLDGALLLFERDSGLNIKLEGAETADLMRVAPRTLLIAVTNICNLQCHFCYRNLASPSDWSYESLLKFCQEASEWGVLEVACLAGNTPVFGPNGMIEVKDLKVGDCVYDSTGVARRITKVTKSERDCITLTGNKGWQVTCTPDHPFIVDGKIVEAQHTLGKQLDQIKNSNHDNQAIANVSILPYILKPTPRSPEMRGGQTGGKIQGNLCKLTSSSAWVPHLIELNEDVMWLYGLSVAEGFKRGIALNQSEREYAERALDIYTDITNGLRGNIRNNSSGNSIAVEFANSRVYRTIFFEAMKIGYGARNKSIKFLFNVDNNMIRAALKGMIDGDGCYRTKKNRRYTDYIISYKTSSKTLANELVYLLYTRFNVFSSIHEGKNSKRRIESRELAISNYYQVEIYGKRNIGQLFPDLFVEDDYYGNIGSSIYSGNKNKDFVQINQIVDAGNQIVYDITLENKSSHIYTLQHGVLTHNCGGGEPTLFKNWASFINELYETSGLCINFTTNGMLLSEEMLKAIEGKYGNIRLSLYETNHWEETVRRLVDCGARFGVNWLISPEDLPTLESKFIKLLALGVRDFLLLSYKGSDRALHFQKAHYAEFETIVNRLYKATEGLAQIKLDSCWGELLPTVPRLFETGDCGAGDEFLSITSDRRIKPCSFHHWTIPFETLADVRQFWEQQRKGRQAAAIGGCARLPMRALQESGGLSNEIIHLAAV